MAEYAVLGQRPLAVFVESLRESIHVFSMGVHLEHIVVLDVGLRVTA